jgi:hypothetical protein
VLRAASLTCCVRMAALVLAEEARPSCGMRLPPADSTRMGGPYGFVRWFIHFFGSHRRARQAPRHLLPPNGPPPPPPLPEFRTSADCPTYLRATTHAIQFRGGLEVLHPLLHCYLHRVMPVQTHTALLTAVTRRVECALPSTVACAVAAHAVCCAAARATLRAAHPRPRKALFAVCVHRHHTKRLVPSLAVPVL